MNKSLEKRMYGFVPYNLSPIQQGIQFGHAVIEYQQEHVEFGENVEEYNDWAENWKTFIILNGGTTNNRSIQGKPENMAGIQHCEEMLDELGMLYSRFKEPDLNDATTAVVFIVDERIFNEDKYPHPENWNFLSPDSNDYYEDIWPGLSRDEVERIFTIREWLFKFKLA